MFSILRSVLPDSNGKAGICVNTGYCYRQHGVHAAVGRVLHADANVIRREAFARPAFAILRLNQHIEGFSNESPFVPYSSIISDPDEPAGAAADFIRLNRRIESGGASSRAARIAEHVYLRAFEFLNDLARPLELLVGLARFLLVGI